MWKKTLATIGSMVLVLSLAVGCAKGNQQGGGAAGGQLTAVGSTAMQPLVEEAANQFMSENPGTQITVQGGGSGAGLSAALNGSADIGNSDLFAEEKQKDPTKLVDHKVFVVGMAPVVNPKVGIDNLTQQQLIDIFTGKIKNWKEVGGVDQKIVLVNRPENSGTRSTFVKYALNGANEYRGKDSIVQDSSGTVRKIVAETPGAIGYLAFSYFDKSIKPVKLDGVEPTNENVYTNKWKVWAYQHMYTNKDGKNKELEEKFINFILTPAVQQNLVEKMGYIPVTKMKVERDAQGNVKEKK
ncbi:phosphate ABC transporter substrate-binding protein PstS family protein [Polycladomyces sp. WAk]|uniref:Phosphate-binding protein n=1 Tax=Polycladomyces zharkentensis TaxID=2807616 RepID=A0ABS2WHH7_9BACL|nr:phosphate ABC transporter substrate-binding protein PstS family protein [Polycladomyces sp. WAk]MBN2909007.1 phosphate ABC transporter substrate-binding protein PstS family protein [Polycladomyces sp. WAk]